ncbi:protein ROS1A-like isoform X5 [Diospyros lotus]|uniref:protein ROS1A-like isoform X5 n=1 Tax=Diospyros lotus TaxID=55363 RepID=UPI0022531561|nr:protein ROS1A-like isoform X5 [Diospyros lotus]
MDSDGVNGSLTSLLALAEAAATTMDSADGSPLRSFNAASSSFVLGFNSQFDGNWFEAGSTTSDVANRDTSFGPNIWSNSSYAPDIPSYGYFTPPRPACDRSSPPEELIDTLSRRNIPFQFEPITPDQSNKVANQAYDKHNLNIDERTNETRDKLGKQVATTNVEVQDLHHDTKQQQLQKDVVNTAASTQLDENHNSDNGGNPGIDLNRTPQQKPRRKKHRPKVVIEGQAKRTPKPVTPKPAKEKPTGKRKYVRKNRLDKTPSTPTEEIACGSIDAKNTPQLTRSCRRKLTLDYESLVREERSTFRLQSDTNADWQAENLYTRVGSQSNMQLGQRMEVTVDKTPTTQTTKKSLEDCILMPEEQALGTQTPDKTSKPQENLKGHIQNQHIKGKCQIVFSDETHDKHRIDAQVMMKSSSISASSPNYSNCSSSLTNTEQGSGLKRGYSCTNHEAEPSRTNMIGGHYNSLCGYLAMLPANIYNNNRTPGLCFPAIYKKKRTEKGHCSTTSRTFYNVTAEKDSVRQASEWPVNDTSAAPSTPETHLRFSSARFSTGSTSNKNASPIDRQGKLFFDQKGRITKKRSKCPTRVRNLASLIGVVASRELPPFPAGGTTRRGRMQGREVSYHPYTCMEALVAVTRATMTTKKRSERNPFAGSMIIDATRRKISTIDDIVDQLKSLENRESIQGRDQKHSEEEKALVLYQRDGTVVPFGGSFDPVRKQRQRPKVDLDEETNRVWELLLENINSEGIDGTDEEKAKWWQEERRVFRGRADSFIARMHLVQGDRRFSPWKGSVVDSVIGVFLTQNVSDHLSSSAFMSIAARYPLKSNRNDVPCSEETNIWAKEPEMCILDPEDTIKWHEEKPNQSAGNRISLTLPGDYYDTEKEVVNSNELLGSNSSGENLTDYLTCKSSDISGNDPQIYNKSTGNRVMIHLAETEANSKGYNGEMDDVVSSWYSTTSSQTSMDSLMTQTAKRVASSLQESQVDLETRSNTNSLTGSSFLKLLQGAETLHSIHERYIEGTKCNIQNKDRSDNHKPLLRSMNSSNSCLQTNPNSGVVEAEFLEMLEKEGLLSDISRKNGEKGTSEQSRVTAESVNQAMIQKNMTASFQEPPRSPCASNHAYSSLQGGVNKIFQSQNRPGGNSNCGVPSQAEEHNCRMQQALEVQNISRENSDVSESTNVITNPKHVEHKEVESILKERGFLRGKAINDTTSDISKLKRPRIGKQKQQTCDWDSLRLQAQANGKRRERTANTMDSLDWEAVRCSDVNEIANTIKERGMNNMLAERIKDFLNRLVREHGSIDLEWLRDIPPDRAKEYLLSIRGLGLKSVECVRLLTLHHLAFPVDTNVGRIAVRLGWVPLQPLPESLQLHLLELYPVLESIQRYLWPRLCKLDQRTLYELHYQMITFGKVFCTKSKPNCNACPMRGECRHFASAFASARLALPGPEEKRIVSVAENEAANQKPVEIIKPLQLSLPPANQQLQTQYEINNHKPIIQLPATTPEPIIEVPATPELEQLEAPEIDIEDTFWEDADKIPTIKLNVEEFTLNLQNYMQQNMELQEGDMSKALVALSTEAASIPAPKLKNVSRLRTEHQVYELPDSHPLLEGLDKREPDDPCSYLLAIWTPGETAYSILPPEKKCSSQEFGKLCDENTCFSCNSTREANSLTVRGTLLVPCRTAMRGSFPLNGTYFQVNEVFADHESSINPIDVPRAWIWNLARRTVYFGTSIPTIFKGLSTESIQYCFWRGFVCVRGFDQKTRAPRPLMARLHFPASKLTKTKGKTNDKPQE